MRRVAQTMARTASARLRWWRLTTVPLWGRPEQPPPYPGLRRRSRRWWQQIGTALGWPLVGAVVFAGSGWLAHRVVDLLAVEPARSAQHRLLDELTTRIVADLGGAVPVPDEWLMWLDNRLPGLDNASPVPSALLLALAAAGWARSSLTWELQPVPSDLAPRALLRRHRSAALLTVVVWSAAAAAVGLALGYFTYRLMPVTASAWHAAGVTPTDPLAVEPARFTVLVAVATAAVAGIAGLRTYWGRFVAVRACLAATGRLPWRTFGFLDAAVRRGELEAVDGGYRFRDPDRARQLLASSGSAVAGEFRWRMEVSLDAPQARVGWARHRTEIAARAVHRRPFPALRWGYRAALATQAWSAATQAARAGAGEAGAWSGQADWWQQVASTAGRWRSTRRLLGPLAHHIAREAWLHAVTEGEPGAAQALIRLVQSGHPTALQSGHPETATEGVGLRELARLLTDDLDRYLAEAWHTRRRWRRSISWRRWSGSLARQAIAQDAWYAAIDAGEPGARAEFATMLERLAETSPGRTFADRVQRLQLNRLALQERIAALRWGEPDAQEALLATMRRWRHSRQRWLGGRLTRWRYLLDAEVALHSSRVRTAGPASPVAAAQPARPAPPRRLPAASRFAERCRQAIDSAAAAAGDDVLTCGQVFGALVRADVYANWRRIWPYDPRSPRLIEAPDTDGTDPHTDGGRRRSGRMLLRWADTPVSVTLATALAWADAEATRTGMRPIPPGLLAYALLRDPRSGAAQRLTTVHAVTRDELLGWVRDDLLRAVDQVD